MLFTEDFSDKRQKAWCVHCGEWISSKPSNRDHVPTKALLSKQLRRRAAVYDKGVGELEDYLPQVVICKTCNESFSKDENYLLCLLHAAFAGSLYPDRAKNEEAANVLRSNRQVVRELRDAPGGQMWLFEDLSPFTIYPDPDRVKNVVVKNARGHAYHELGEPFFGAPQSVQFVPLQTLDERTRNEFEFNERDEIDVWPEVGSRMMERLVAGHNLQKGWIIVEPGRYRYSLDWREGVTVKTVIWEYLATETRWND